MACHALIDHRALPLTRKAQEGAFGVKCFSRIRTTCRALLDDKSLWGKLDRQAISPCVSRALRMLYICFSVMNSL